MPGSRHSIAALLCLLAGLVGPLGLTGCVPGGIAGRGVSAAGPAAATVPVVRGTVAHTVRASGALSGVAANEPGSVAVVPFEEADAAPLRRGQQTRVSPDAVPGLELDGEVAAVAPSGVNISGVTNYYVTVVLTSGDPRLRAGQTVRVAVATSVRRDVLLVPNSSVLRRGSDTAVRVPGPDGEPVRREFTPGVVGEEATEVVSGLAAGQLVFVGG